MTDYYISSLKRGTGRVTLDDNKIIIDAPPVWKRFIGQYSGNLSKWLETE